MAAAPREPTPAMMEAALAELAAIGRELLAIDPDMPEHDPQLYVDMLEGESRGDAFQVIDQLVFGALERETFAGALQQLRDNWAERESRFKTAASRRRDVVLRLMDTLRISKLERPGYTVAVTAGRVHVVPTLPAEQLPARFQRVSYEADKTALSAALTAGEPDTPAEWSNRQPYLTIRTR